MVGWVLMIFRIFLFFFVLLLLGVIWVSGLMSLSLIGNSISSG